MTHGENVVTRFCRTCECKGDTLRCVLGSFHLFHSVDSLLTAFRGNDIALAVPASLLFYISFESCDLLLLIFVSSFLSEPFQLLFLGILGVGTLIKLCLAVFYIEGLIRYAVKKISVMRNEDDRFLV